MPDQPEGIVPDKLKVAGAQDKLSLSVTVTVKITAVPGITDWLCEGDIVTVGLAEEHDDPVIVICTVAPVLLTAVGTKVRPAVESLKLCPVGRAISKS